MTTKKKATLAALIAGALAALSIGTAAIAQTSPSAPTQAPATVQQESQQVAPVDNDTTQFESQSEADDATEAPGKEDGKDDGKEDGTDQGKDEQSPSYSSSITAPQGTDTGAETKDDEAAEAKALASTPGLIGEQAAQDAALAAFPGTVQKVELDNENGNIVYSVEITNDAGASADVKVDAGNGTVLHQEAGGADEGGEEAGED